MTSKQVETFKSIISNIKELKLTQLDGITIKFPNDLDMYKIYIGIEINNEKYNGIIIPMTLHIPFNFPNEAPAINLIGKYKFDDVIDKYLVIINDLQYINDDMLSIHHTWNTDGALAVGWNNDMTLLDLLNRVKNIFNDENNYTKYPEKYIFDRIQLTSIKNFNEYIKSEVSEEIIYYSVNGQNIKLSEIIDEKYGKLICLPIDVQLDKHDRIIIRPILELMDITEQNRNYHIANEEFQSNDILEHPSKFKFFTTNSKPYSILLPCCTHDGLFNYHKSHFEYCIRSLYNELYNSTDDFNVSMIVKVIPIVMNKIMPKIIAGNSSEHKLAIEIYCMLSHLLYKLIDMYPELKSCFNIDIETFLESNYNRHKKAVVDLGETLIRLSFSDYDYFDVNGYDIRKKMIQEFLSRQIYWMNKYEPSIMNVKTMNRLTISFDNGIVVNQLFVFCLEITKMFINENVKHVLYENNGFIPHNLIDMFDERMSVIRGVNNWESFTSIVRYDDAFDNGNFSDNLMNELLNNAILLSNKQNYSNIYIRNYHNQNISDDDFRDSIF